MYRKVYATNEYLISTCPVNVTLLTETRILINHTESDILTLSQTTNF